MNCGGSGSYSYEDDDEPDTVIDTRFIKRDEYSKRAWDYYMDFKEEDALYYIDLALDLDGRHANNWNVKAIILEAMKRYGESEECYNRSLELSKQPLVCDNKARMLRVWARHLLEESKELPNGLAKLKEALDAYTDKFLKQKERFAGDNSRIAQWLRAIDTINREADFSEFAADPVFKVLQNEVKLCNFSARYMRCEMMKDFDEAWLKHRTACEIAKNLRDKGVDISIIKETTNLSEKEIREL